MEEACDRLEGCLASPPAAVKLPGGLSPPPPSTPPAPPAMSGLPGRSLKLLLLLLLAAWKAQAPRREDPCAARPPVARGDLRPPAPPAPPSPSAAWVDQGDPPGAAKPLGEVGPPLGEIGAPSPARLLLEASRLRMLRAAAAASPRSMLSERLLPMLSTRFRLAAAAGGGLLLPFTRTLLVVRAGLPPPLRRGLANPLDPAAAAVWPNTAAEMLRVPGRSTPDPCLLRAAVEKEPSRNTPSAAGLPPPLGPMGLPARGGMDPGASSRLAPPVMLKLPWRLWEAPAREVPLGRLREPLLASTLRSSSMAVTSSS